MNKEKLEKLKERFGDDFIWEYDDKCSELESRINKILEAILED